MFSQRFDLDAPGFRVPLWLAISTNLVDRRNPPPCSSFRIRQEMRNASISRERFSRASPHPSAILTRERQFRDRQYRPEIWQSLTERGASFANPIREVRHWMMGDSNAKSWIATKPF